MNADGHEYFAESNPPQDYVGALAVWWHCSKVYGFVSVGGLDSVENPWQSVILIILYIYLYHLRGSALYLEDVMQIVCHQGLRLLYVGSTWETRL